MTGGAPGPTLRSMSHDPNPTESKGAGFSGSLRAIASLCVLALAATGVLVVLEVIPRSVFADVGGKVLAIGGIGLVAALAIGLLAKR